MRYKLPRTSTRGKTRPSMRSASPAPLSRLLLLKKALEAAFFVFSGAYTPTQASLGLLFSVTGQGTNGLQHSAPDFVQRPFGPVSFATLHLMRSYLLGAHAPYPKIPGTRCGGLFCAVC